MRALFSIIIGAAMAVACYDATKPLPPYQPIYGPGPGPDDLYSSAKSCEDACAHLRDLGCPEGQGSLGGEPCSVTCQRATELRALPLACWSAAKTQADAKACGSLRCVR